MRHRAIQILIWVCAVGSFGAAVLLTYYVTQPPAVVSEVDYPSLRIDKAGLLVNGDGSGIRQSDSVRGYLETMVLGTSSITISGWAANVSDNTPAKTVVLFVGNRVAAFGPTGQIRSDVASQFRRKNLAASGFTLTATPVDLSQEGRPIVRVFAIDQAGWTNELNYIGKFPLPQH